MPEIARRPDHYIPLAAGYRCKCFNMWRDADGSLWCCGSAADVSIYPEGDRLRVPALDASNVAQLVPTKSDADVAKELRDELEARLRDVAAVMDKCVAAGFVPQFGMNFAGPPIMKHQPTNVVLAKHF